MTDEKLLRLLNYLLSENDEYDLDQALIALTDKNCIGIAFDESVSMQENESYMNFLSKDSVNENDSWFQYLDTIPMYLYEAPLAVSTEEAATTFPISHPHVVQFIQQLKMMDI